MIRTCIISLIAASIIAALVSGNENDWKSKVTRQIHDQLSTMTKTTR